VAQGSNLGPLLFSIFINDIGEVIGNDVEFDLYADDLKMSKRIESVADAEVLQSSLDRLKVYCEKNNLQLNVKKCTFINFTRNATNFVNHNYHIGEHKLERCTSYKDLGVIYDNKLSFAQHIDSIYHKCNRLIGFIYRIGKEFRWRSSLCNVFKSLVRSHTEYACQIWNPHFSIQVDRIEKIQRKFARLLHNKGMIPEVDEFNYDDCCKALGLEPLIARRKIADINLVVKSFNGKVDSGSFIDLFNFSIPTRNTRKMSIFKPNFSNTDIGKFSPMNRLMNTFNEHGENWDLFYNPPGPQSVKTKVLQPLNN
jgi:hypothetical protein